MQLTLLHAPLLPRHTIAGHALKIKIDAHTHALCNKHSFVHTHRHSNTHSLQHSHTHPANRCQFRSKPHHTHRHPHPRPQQQQQQKTGENVTQKSIIFRYERKRVKTAIREHFSIYRTRTPIIHTRLCAHTHTHITCTYIHMYVLQRVQQIC